MRSSWAAGLALTVALLLSALGVPVTDAPDPDPPAAVLVTASTSSGSNGDTDDPAGTAADKPAKRRVTVAVSGDVLVHTGVWQSAQRAGAAHGRDEPYFPPMFASLRPVVSGADLAVCHLETPLAPPGGPYRNYPLFSAPPQVVDGLVATGYDACTTASNHAVDMGFDGLARTVRALGRRGMAHTGTYASRRASQRELLIDVAGVRIGLLSTTYGTNGMPVSEPWSVDLLDVDRTLRRAAQLRRAGADVVMVAVHSGYEYVTAPSPEQVQAFDALSASPNVDFVYGHHAHVVQPFARPHGEWVVYGLGNFVAEQELGRPDTYRGMTAEITFVEGRDGTFRGIRPRFVPTLITHPSTPWGTTVLDAPRALANPRTPAWARPLLQEAVREVRADVIRPGVRMIAP